MVENVAKLRFPARTDELQTLRDRVRDILHRQQCQENCIDEVVLALNEACMNIIQHAYGENHEQGDIVLEIEFDDGWLTFRLTDFAPPIDKSTCQSRELDDIRPGGLGMHFIQTLMDEYRFVDPADNIGNILEMRKKV